MKLEERFLSHAQQTEGCWFWDAHLTKDGYGMFNMGNGMVTAHRAAYELFVGEIPKGLVIDHLCSVRDCVNPEHLEPVTQRENLRRAATWKGNQTKCKRGHDYGVQPTWTTIKNFRRCRQCINENQRLRRRQYNAT